MKTNKDSELLEMNIRTALETILQDRKIGKKDIEWFSKYLESLSSILRAISDSSIEGYSKEVEEGFKSIFSKETREYDQEELKWIRYRQTRSKTIDDIVKSKDKLARSIKEGKIDLDHVINSAAEGDIESLITIYPYFAFGFQRYEPSWWERFLIFLFRRKIDTNPS